MSLIQDMKKHKNLTEREQDIRKRLKRCHPENLVMPHLPVRRR